MVRIRKPDSDVEADMFTQMMRRARLVPVFGATLLIFVGGPSVFHMATAAAADAQDMASLMTSDPGSATSVPTPRGLKVKRCTQANRTVAVPVTAARHYRGDLYSVTATATQRLCTTKRQTTVYSQTVTLSTIDHSGVRLTTQLGQLRRAATPAGTVSTAPVTITSKTRWSGERTVVGQVRITVANDGAVAVALTDVHKA